LFAYEGIGTTSRQAIKVAVYLTSSGSGIQFVLSDPKEEKPIKIPALANNVVNTLRNVTIGQGGARLCLVEHFLAAAAFCNVFDIDVVVDGPELPLGDGSALIWLDLFSQAGYKPVVPDKKIQLKEAVFITKGDRQLIALPAADFSMTYLMDWSHPAIGKRWFTWTAKQSPSEIACARTFGSQKEHNLLGIGGEAVSLTESGFSKALHFEDEPVRHKLLDLFGDLVLSGINPLSIQAQFISIKGGHEMDVDLVKQLENKLKS
jgi:UDP-3-O-acyl-N-acetylglucosamine deacetylase